MEPKKYLLNKNENMKLNFIYLLGKAHRFSEKDYLFIQVQYTNNTIYQ